MKKIISLYCTLLVSILLCIDPPTYGQVSVRMETDASGLNYVPCSINNVKMRLILDTGASTVSLSREVVNALLRQGALSEDDFGGNVETVIANGSRTRVQLVNLEDFELGGIHVKNVLATVHDGQSIPLLMGMSAIEKLGRISIDGNRLTIHQPPSLLSPKEIQNLLGEIYELYDNGLYLGAINKFEQFKRAEKLSSLCYHDLIMCCHELGDVNLCIENCEEWYAEYHTDEPDITYWEIYWMWANMLSRKSLYSEAILRYQEAFLLCPSYTRTYIQSQIGSCYYFLRDKNNAESVLRTALSARLDELSVSTSDVENNNVEDLILGDIYCYLAWCADSFDNDQYKYFQYLRLGAKCGDEYCIDKCVDNRINYRIKE